MFSFYYTICSFWGVLRTAFALYWGKRLMKSSKLQTTSIKGMKRHKKSAPGFCLMHFYWMSLSEDHFTNTLRPLMMLMPLTGWLRRRPSML